jgi:hypothetical protein
MNVNNYIKVNLVKKNSLLGGDYIFKTPEINEFLIKNYGNENVTFNVIKSQEINKKLANHFGENYIKKVKDDSDKIYYELLVNLEKFLHDAVLAINLFVPIKKEIDDSLEEIYIKKKDINGIPPFDYLRIPSIYAHAFLDALVKISSTYKIMLDEKKTPYIHKTSRNKLKALKLDFENSFPKIWDVRNSWQHIEDRMRGKGKQEKNLETSQLVLSCLMDNNLTYTISDGSIHSIEISLDSYLKIEKFVQLFFDVFEWIEGEDINIPL